MNRWTGPARCVLVAAALTASVTACTSPGDLSIENVGPAEVTVLTGDEEVTVTPDGGVVLLGYGCTPGDVTVKFASGEVLVVPGPVCPDQRIVVRDGEVELLASSPGTT